MWLSKLGCHSNVRVGAGTKLINKKEKIMNKIR